MPERISEFGFENQPQRVVFVETMQVNESVECDVYSFEGDNEKDLGIIRIALGGNTPLQKVLKGERTIEGHVSGKGKLIITTPEGQIKEYAVNNDDTTPFSIDVGIGEIMQWQADEDSNLVAFEICIPPYEDGRFENL